MTVAITPANLLFVILFVNRYVTTSSDADAKNGITLWLPKIKNDDESKNNVTELFQPICSGGQFSAACLTNFQSSWLSSEFTPSYDNAVKADKITIIAIFINSDGWRFKKYKFIHLWDPDTAVPKKVAAMSKINTRT